MDICNQLSMSKKEALTMTGLNLVALPTAIELVLGGLSRLNSALVGLPTWVSVLAWAFVLFEALVFSLFIHLISVEAGK